MEFHLLEHAEGTSPMPKGIDSLESELSDASLPFGARLCAYTQKKHKLIPF